MNREIAQTEESFAQAKVHDLHVLKLCANVPAGIAISAAGMLLLTFIVNVSGVPNPNMILVTGLVIFASIFGHTGGITAAIIMMAYSLAFFSTNNDFVTFTEQNMQKVLVSATGIVIITFFVSALRHIITRTLISLEQLNEVLEEDNKLLEEATAVDSLTSTRNRFGLRRDFNGYLNKNLYVMMIDIDNFKNLNDTHGHQMGDYILSQIGRNLNELCGQEYVYRYGGDEFLIVIPEEDGEKFSLRAQLLKERIASIELEGANDSARFSAGYVYGEPSIQSDLRLMIRQADANLYESKHAGKNMITGTPFSRAKTQALSA